MERKDIITVEDYQRYVEEKIDSLLPIFARAAIGDFSNIEIPDKEDEFSKLYAGVDILLDVARRSIVGLEEANTKLHEEIAKRDKFTAMLAHELRNPLAPIISSLELIRMKNGDNKLLQEEINIIDRQFKHLIRLLQDLLDISRIVHGKVHLQLTTVDLNNIIKNAIETSRPLSEAEKHELLISLSKDPIYVSADPMRLEQIIVNVLNNAAKYTPAAGRIWVTASANAKEAIISIKDTGIGIAPEMLPRVFDLFSQVDPSQTRVKGGLGIGLMLARGLIELQGGIIRAFSAGLNQGTEFVITLPLVQAPASIDTDSEKTNGLSRRQEGQRRRIVIVDDNEDAVNTLASVLKELGHDVQCAYEGEKALDVISQSQTDIVLLDIEMPRMNGYEVIRRLKQMNDFKAKVIAVTGYGKEEDRRKTKEAGFDHHLVKPINLNDLKEIL